MSRKDFVVLASRVVVPPFSGERALLYRCRMGLQMRTFGREFLIAS